MRRRRMGDFNGDGAADILIRLNDWSMMTVALQRFGLQRKDSDKSERLPDIGIETKQER